MAKMSKTGMNFNMLSTSQSTDAMDKSKEQKIKYITMGMVKPAKKNELNISGAPKPPKKKLTTQLGNASQQENFNSSNSINGFANKSTADVIKLANQSLDAITDEQNKLKNSFVVKSRSAQPKET